MNIVPLIVAASMTVNVAAAQPIAEPNENDLYILAHLINGEAGADWCSDNMMYGVGSVVLNRVSHELFPDSIEEVVFQEGQYACTWDGNYDKEPCERAWTIAELLLKNGSVLPENVIFQANFEQGDGTFLKEQNMYFCYIGDKPVIEEGN